VFESAEAARLTEAVSNRDNLPSGDIGPPLDLVHLARQCLGDHELEDELLGLFRQQLRTLLAQLSDPALLPLESKAKIAHKVRGSALAVGARRVAEAALRIEEMASGAGKRAEPSDDERAGEAPAIAALLAAVTEALAEIERIRG
jgi:hypothetical protein